MGPPGASPLCVHTYNSQGNERQQVANTPTQATHASSYIYLFSLCLGQVVACGVRQCSWWSVNGGVGGGGGTEVKSGESDRGNEGGAGGLAVFAAVSDGISLRKARSIPPSTQPLLSPLPKVELFSRPLRPSFQKQPCMKEQLFVKQPNN